MDMPQADITSGGCINEPEEKENRRSFEQALLCSTKDMETFVLTCRGRASQEGGEEDNKEKLRSPAAFKDSPWPSVNNLSSPLCRFYPF